MGRLIDEALPSFYNGVSRQPANVRMTSQVQEADNVDLSVVTGGFEKRDPLQHLGTLAGYDAAETWCLHTIDRDASERYVVLVASDGSVEVFDGFDGTAQTVTLKSGQEAALTAYLSAGVDNAKRRYAFMTIVDVTYITNREVDTAMAAASSGTVLGYYQTFADLTTAVPSPSDGDIYGITGDPSDLDNYFVRWSAADSQWVETVDPNGQNAFDPATMPVTLTRTGAGTFEVAQVDWSEREVGSEATVPAPKWIGSPITDIVFYKNRIAFLGASNIYFSQAGDFNNLWPDKATDVLDSDPIDLTATGTRRSLLQWGVPYRRTLFLTGDQVQFEQNNQGLLTPLTASVDETTSYSTPNLTKPVVLGSELYFASEVSGNGIVYEYYFDDSTLSNTADDVTKHVLGYLPGSITRMAADPASGKLFVMVGDSTSDLYVYTVYWNGSEKIQSAWCRWTFDGTIVDFDVLSGELQVVLEKDTAGHLLKVALSDTDTDAGFNVRLDYKVALTGVYDAGTDRTTWTTPYTHGDLAQVVLSSDFASTARLLTVTYDSTTTLSAAGDWSAGEALVGLPYRSAVTLSRLYPRTQGRADQSGRVQATKMTLYFENTGFFQVTVKRRGRADKVTEYTGRNVGLLNNITGSLSVADGELRVPLRSRTDRLEGIVIESSSFLPFTITSGTWAGFFNVLERQG